MLHVGAEEVFVNGTWQSSAVTVTLNVWPCYGYRYTCETLC